MAKPIRVLVIDDSALARSILTKGLDMDPGIKVIGSASDPYIARDKIIKLKPDVLTLDVEMPRMDGVEFLRKLMPQYPIPVIMVSALTERGKQITLDALSLGAIDFVTKPTKDSGRNLNSMITELRSKIKAASTANMSRWREKRHFQSPEAAVPTEDLTRSENKIIAIGASTGGTEAIREIITKFPSNIPGIIIVQHMPPGFTKMFAERMDRLCRMDVKEAEDKDRIIPGRILIAPGARQMTIRRIGKSDYEVNIFPGEPFCGHCPSVEVMMNSVAEQAGSDAIGIMLTGMGNDGARGMLAMRLAGARTIAQDEKSCVVFGMPWEAYKSGGAERLVPLDRISGTVINLLLENGKVRGRGGSG